MLQDASGWAQVCDDACRVKPYTDPLLRRRELCVSFLARLFAAGVLSFTRRVHGRIGAFAVPKKPKLIGGKKLKRQRLVLDCRQVNLKFRAPRITELGSLAALGEAEVPDGERLFIAGADIEDCFYACLMPRERWDHFSLEQDVTVKEARVICNRLLPRELEGLASDCLVDPCFKVLPRVFNWSFYLVQKLHEQQVVASSGCHQSSLVVEE
jgi:hypothetical protein